jgi:predicted transcriptional regulator
MRTFLFALLPCLWLMSSCSQEKKAHEHSGHEHQAGDEPSASGKLYKEVIGIHDAVMPRMDELMQYKGQVKKELDSLSKAKSFDPTRKQQLDSLYTALESAEVAMEDWMTQFDSQMKDKTEEQKVAYLKTQQEKVEEVRDRMNSSLTKAQQLLSKKP